jgi:hypothetical protein
LSKKFTGTDKMTFYDPIKRDFIRESDEHLPIETISIILTNKIDNQ